MSWGALGDIAFEPLAGPVEEQHRWAVDLAEHARINGQPRLQYIAPKLQELTLRIRLHTSLNLDPEASLQSWKRSMEAGEVLDLVVGEQAQQGLWAGQWLLSGLDVAVLDRWPWGAIRHAELTLTLREWVDPQGLALSQRKQTPKAIKKKGSPPPSVAAGPGYEGGKPPGGA